MAVFREGENCWCISHADKAAFLIDGAAYFESVTDAYFLLHAGLGFKVRVQQQFLEFSVLASNLLNETYFDHLSTLKPMGLYNMGRNVTFNLVVPFGIKSM